MMVHTLSMSIVEVYYFHAPTDRPLALFISLTYTSVHYYEYPKSKGLTRTVSVKSPAD